MATPDVGGPASGAHVPLEIDGDSRSTSSQSTSQTHDLSQQLQIGGNNCPWRTERYFDQECSRYFDCPSHIVERAPSDTDDERGEQAHQEGGSDTPEEDHGEHVEGEHHGSIGSGSGDEADRPSPAVLGNITETELEDVRSDNLGAFVEEVRQESEEEESDVAEVEGDDRPGSVSPLSEDTEDDSDRSARSLSPEAAPETTHFSESPEPSGSPTREQQGVSVSVSEFTSGAIHRTQQESERPVVSQSSGWENLGAASSTSSLGIRTMADLPSRPSVNTSASSFGSVLNSPDPPQTLPAPNQHTRSELQLPRWQPDSEQTYCPICGTQFSFFVRKHHCR